MSSAHVAPADARCYVYSGVFVRHHVVAASVLAAATSVQKPAKLVMQVMQFRGAMPTGAFRQNHQGRQADTFPGSFVFVVRLVFNSPSVRFYGDVHWVAATVG